MSGEKSGPKRVGTGLRLLESTVAALDAAGERMGGKSRAFVVEVLVALYAGQLDADTPIPASMFPAGARAAGAGGKRPPKSKRSGR